MSSARASRTSSCAGRRSPRDAVGRETQLRVTSIASSNVPGGRERRPLLQPERREVGAATLRSANASSIDGERVARTRRACDARQPGRARRGGRRSRRERRRTAGSPRRSRRRDRGGRRARAGSRARRSVTTRLALGELGGAAEVDDRLLVRVQPPRALAGADEVVDRLRARLAEVEVACEQVDDVVARAVQRLGDLGDPAVQVAPLPSQQARVRDVLHERVVEGDGRLLVVGDAVEEAALRRALSSSPSRSSSLPRTPRGAERGRCGRSPKPSAEPRRRVSEGGRCARPAAPRPSAAARPPPSPARSVQPPSARVRISRSRSARTSSSTKNGLPVVRSTTQGTRPGAARPSEDARHELGRCRPRRAARAESSALPAELVERRLRLGARGQVEDERTRSRRAGRARASARGSTRRPSARPRARGPAGSRRRAPRASDAKASCRPRRNASGSSAATSSSAGGGSPRSRAKYGNRSRRRHDRARARRAASSASVCRAGCPPPCAGAPRTASTRGRRRTRGTGSAASEARSPRPAGGQLRSAVTSRRRARPSRRRHPRARPAPARARRRSP